MGAAYDLFGNGKTRDQGERQPLRGLHRSMRLPASVNPFVTSRNNATRNWFDANHDFIPQGDPLNPLPNGEIFRPDRPELRQVGHHHPIRLGLEPGLGKAAVQLGIPRERAAASCCPASPWRSGTSGGRSATRPSPTTWT